MLVITHKPLLAFTFFLFVWNSSQGQIWSLQQCIDTAQVYNKHLQMSRNNLAIGEQKQKEARANLMPKITANADYKYFTNLPYQLMPLSTFNPAASEGTFKEAQFGVPHNLNANLQLVMPLYNPQVYGAIQTTKLALELTDLQVKKNEEQVYFEISNLYYNAQILYHQLAFLDSNYVNAERLLKNSQLLKNQLLAKETDVSKINLLVMQLAFQKENINSKFEHVLQTLKFSMGISMDRAIKIEPTIPYQNTEEYASLSPLDIRIAKSQNQMLSSDLQTLNNSRYWPTLSLVGTYGTTGFGYNQSPNEFLKFFPIGFAGIQLSYPIFNGSMSQLKISQKKIELKNNDLHQNWLSEQNKLQIHQAKQQKRLSERAVETATEQINLAHLIYKQIIVQQKQGTAILTDVLLADNALREAQQTYLTAVVDFLKSDLELKKYTGNLQSLKK